MDTGSSSSVKRRSSRTGEQPKYPGSSQKPAPRRLFRTPIQTVPLKSDVSRPERSASKSFVFIPDNEKETPRSLIQELLVGAATQSVTHVSKKSKLSLTPVEKDSTFKVPQLTEMVLRNRTQSLLKAPVTTPSRKYTPRTNVWDLLMDDVEVTPASKTQSLDLEKIQTSKSRLSEVQHSDLGQRVTLSPLDTFHQRNSTPVTHVESVYKDMAGVRTRKRFILEQAAQTTEANNLKSQQSMSQVVGHNTEDLSDTSGLNKSKARVKIDIKNRFNLPHNKIKHADKKNMSAAASQRPLTADLSMSVEDEEADYPGISDSGKIEQVIERTISNSVFIDHGSSILEAPSGGHTTSALGKLQSSALSHANKINTESSFATGDDLQDQPSTTSVYDVIEGSTSEDEQNSKSTSFVKKRMRKRKRSSSMGIVLTPRKNMSQLTSGQKYQNSSPSASPFTRSKQKEKNTRLMTPDRNITTEVTHVLRSSTPVPRKGILHSTKVHETNSSYLSVIENNFMDYSVAPHITDLSPIRPDTRFQKHKDIRTDEVPSNMARNQEDRVPEAAGRSQEYNVLDVPSRNEDHIDLDSGLENQEHTASINIQEHDSNVTKAPHNQHASFIDLVARSHENDVSKPNKEPLVEENNDGRGNHDENQEVMTQVKDHKNFTQKEVTKDYRSKSAMNNQQQNGDDKDIDSQEVGRNTSLQNEPAEYTELPSGVSPLTTPDSNLTNRKEISAKQVQRRCSTNKITGGAKTSNSNQDDPKVNQARKPRRKPTAVPKKTCLPRKSVKFFAERHSSMKLSPDAIDEIVNVSEIYWDDTFKALERYALHAGRKVINEEDVILLMKTQGMITGTEDLYDKIREYLPMELRTELIPIAKF